jgi:hypothetical protein
MASWLDTGAAIAAFIAAAFWFLSAHGKLPSTWAYWDQAADTDPSSRAIKFSSRMNSIAAAFTGASVLLLGAKLVLLPG